MPCCVGRRPSASDVRVCGDRGTNEGHASAHGQNFGRSHRILEVCRAAPLDCQYMVAPGPLQRDDDESTETEVTTIAH